MAKSLYISTIGSDSGKSLFTLGSIEFFVKKYKQVAFFRPIISGKLTTEKERIIENIISHLDADITYDDTYAFVKEEAYDLISSGRYDELLERIIYKFKQLEEKYSFVICEGTSYGGITSSFELDINADIAKNLGSPVVIVANSLNRSLESLVSTFKMTHEYYKQKDCTLAGYCFNRIEQNLVEGVKKKLQRTGFLSFIPENQDVHDKKVLLLKTFRDNVDVTNLHEMIKNYKSIGTTYKMFEYNLLSKAKESIKHIVLPEGEDDRILQAAEVLLNRNAVKLTILGDELKISQKIKKMSLNLSSANFIDPKVSDKRLIYSKKLFELRKHKGLTEEKAEKLIEDVNYFGTMMINEGEADGMVSGAAHTTGETIRPALQIVKTRKGFSIVSSIFFMCLDNRVVIYGDCAINTNPNAEQLAEIAISSNDTAISFGIDAKVAMLSYSSGDSGQGEDVELVKKATDIVKNKRPDILIEGPIQYDAAVDANTAKKKMPDSKVAGSATVLIFPDLNTGNNTYKAVQRESGAQAIGPMLQGLNKPVNDLSRGCFVMDIVNTTLLTAIQAQDIDKGRNNI